MKRKHKKSKGAAHFNNRHSGYNLQGKNNRIIIYGNNQNELTTTQKQLIVEFEKLSYKDKIEIMKQIIEKRKKADQDSSSEQHQESHQDSSRQ